jgi:polyphosphate kinase 2
MTQQFSQPANVAPDTVVNPAQAAPDQAAGDQAAVNEDAPGPVEAGQAEEDKSAMNEDPRDQKVATLRSELDLVKHENQRLRYKSDLELELQPYQVELLKLQAHLEATQQKMIVLFEGRDAAGKGGTIRRITRYMNEKHYQVVALGRPTDQERTQWYFQRYISRFPRGGEIILFDRSWYNRAMVEPVFGFCTEKEHADFLRGVVGFEKDLVRQGTTLVKLYFSVPKNEQLRRFERRKHDPLRQWKLSEIDVQAQDLWDEFTERKYEMLKETHTNKTPWTVIRSKEKHKARINAMRVILGSIDYAGRSTDLDFVPDPKVVVSGAHEVELMEADRIRGGKFKL